MSKDDAPEKRDKSLSAYCDRVCQDLIEERWRRAPGFALRVALTEPGVVERPGRTRFDLRWDAPRQRFDGPVRASLPELPLLDGSLALVILDRLAISDRQVLKCLLDEVFRVLVDDGRVLILDTSPWGWLGLRGRWLKQPTALSAGRIIDVLHDAGLEDVELRRALCWPPAPAAWLQEHGDWLDRGLTRVVPMLGSLYSVCGRKRSSNVIAIPFARDRRHGLLAAPEGMRRAG